MAIESSSAAPKESVQAGQTAYVDIPAGSRLNVYKKASTASGLAGLLERGAQAKVYAVQGAWAAVKSCAVKGYVKKEYLSAKPLAGLGASLP